MNYQINNFKQKNEKFSICHFLLIFILVVTNVYAFPMFVTIAADGAVLLLSGCLFTNVKDVSTNKNVYIVLSFLTLYTFFVCLNAHEFSNYTIGKPLRLFFVYIIFSMMARKMAYYSNKEIISGVIMGLMVQLICVFIQFFIPSTKVFFYGLIDAYEKEIILERSLRSFGLFSSFDSAGLCICVLMVLLWLVYKRTHNLFIFILSTIALLACFLVGRTAMIIGSIFYLFLLLSLFKTQKKYFIISSVAFVCIAIYIGNEAVDLFDRNTFDENYHSQSVDYLTGSMLYLPKTLSESILGTGISPSDSDIGYIKLIHMIGFLGLFGVLYMYYCTINNIRPYKRQAPDFYSFILLFLALLLFYNYKLLLLYASGMNDLYFLLYFIYIRKLKIQHVLNLHK